MYKQVFIYVLPIAITATGLFFATRTSMLRDMVSSDRQDFQKLPFSFSRVQLLWWFTIISSCFCGYFGKNETLDLFFSNYSLLILLGISLGTTVAAKIIDNTDIGNNLVRHQEKHSEGFLHDILSDQNGISVHRFQAFAFNIIFGLMFIYTFKTQGNILKFGEVELSLMGISSAAYLGLKINENSVSKDENGIARNSQIEGVSQ